MSVAPIVEFSLEHPAVFVVGMERGGTSILYQTLSTASAFTNRAGNQETFIFDKPERALTNEALDMTVQYMGGMKQMNEFRNWFKNLKGWPPEWQRSRQIATAYFYYASQIVHKGSRVIEKTPRHAFSLDLMFQCFPKARAIGSVRHPFGVIESYRSRLKREKELGLPQSSYAWLERTPHQICAHVAKISEAVHQGKERYKDRMIVVSYEELLRDPELVFAVLGKFLKINDLKFTVTDDAVSDRTSGSDPLLTSGKIHKANAFKTSLPIEERMHLLTSFPALFATTAGIHL